MGTLGPHRGHKGGVGVGGELHIRKKLTTHRETKEPVWTSKTKANPLHDSITPDSKKIKKSHIYLAQK